HVPDHLRDRHRPGAQDYGDYKYPHDFEGGWVEQQYLPNGLKDAKFFEPGPRGWEASRAEVLKRRKNQ
ncbi:MAG: recombinase RarA, partial [Enterococcus sp.]|nr:recombinase RarA [Enterococcus sp.]